MSNFYNKYSHLTQYRIDRIDEIVRHKKQPDFIHMFSVNGHEIAFLGERPDNPEQFLNYYARMDRMNIPQFAQMVDYEVLKKVLQTEGKDSENKAISTAQKGLLYGSKMEESIYLNVFGMVRPYHLALKYHHCDNFNPEATLPKGVYALKRGRLFSACGQGHFSSYFTDKDQLQHKLVLFYLSAEDIEKASELEAEKYREIHKQKVEDDIANWSISFPIKSKLQIFFGEPKAIPTDLPKGLDWSKLKGVFMLPYLTVDQSIAFQCILNVDGEESSNMAQSTRKNLLEWIESVEGLNDSDGEKEIFVGVDDLYRAEIEEWSSTISKNVSPITGDREEMLKPCVLESERA